MLIYDCEIEKAISGRNEERLEGIKYCNGWNDHAGMGVSCIGVYDYIEDKYRLFCKDNFKDFEDLMSRRSLLVGFNNLNFDNRLITANRISIPPSINHYDILVEVWAAHGLGPQFNFRTHGGYGLDLCCQVNFGSHKSGHGALAPVQWQRGEIGSVIDYCLNDVKMTKQLFDAAINGFELNSPKGGKMKLRIPEAANPTAA